MRLAVPAGTCVAAALGEWTLYELAPRANDSPLWPVFKLMRAPTTTAVWGERRAFTLAWSPLNLRFRRDREQLALQRILPELYERVELALSLHYDRDWLTDFLEPEEIEAERARLKALRAKRKAEKAAARSGE